jgi:hypothetical protein
MGSSMSEDPKMTGSVNNGRVWYEIPLACQLEGEEACLPFECEGEAILVYHELLAYASFTHLSDENNAAKVPGSRRLTVEDVLKLNAELPYPYLTAMHSRSGTLALPSAYFGLGDALSWCLRKMGFSECDDCDSRRNLLNRIPLWPRRKHALETVFPDSYLKSE